MVRFIRIAFSGRDFFGTQKQPQKRTIQGLFEHLLSQIYNEKVKVTISSRLDRKVNANDFGLSFSDPGKNISDSHLFYYLRRSLDEDVTLKEIRQLDNDTFSARYNADYKRYLYLLQNRMDPHPFFSSFTYHPAYHPLDPLQVKQALSLFQGQHDFRAFATPEGEENTLLTIDSTSFEERGNDLYLRFQGRNFLRYQVRFMVGAILSHCEGKLSLDDIQSLLNGEERHLPKLKAEPQGLMLEQIHYPAFDDDQQNIFVLPTI